MSKASKAKDRKISELTAKLADARAAGFRPSSGDRENRTPNADRGGARGGGRGRGRGTGRGAQTDRTPRDCSKCGETHWGKCLQDRVADQEERLAADKARLREMGGSTKKREQRAARHAATIGSFNESDSEYFRVLPCPGDSPTDLNVYVGRVVLSTSASTTDAPTDYAVVDSGENLGMTPRAEHSL
eukprot:2259557-Rhodomonas_salina.1